MESIARESIKRQNLYFFPKWINNSGFQGLDRYSQKYWDNYRQQNRNFAEGTGFFETQKKKNLSLQMNQKIFFDFNDDPPFYYLINA